MFFFDIPNLLVCLTVVFIAWRIKTIPDWIALVLICYSFIPFFLNDFILPVGYMGDQSLYTATLDAVRSGDILGHVYTNNCKDYNKYEWVNGWTVEVAKFNEAAIGKCPFTVTAKAVVTSWFLALLPVPFVETENSIGFFNRFLFLILFLWLYQKKFLKGLPLYFIIFYPSLVLYSSLGLRDMLILFLMVVSIIFLVEQKKFRFLITIIPLYFIKLQNFYLMFIFFMISIILKKQTLLYKMRYIIVVLSFAIFVFYFDEIIFIIERDRVGMFYENYGTTIGYNPINSIYDLIIESLKGFFHYLLKPLPWEIGNSLQLIQSIENILLLIFLILFTKKAYNESAFLTFKWLLFLIISLTIYGVVVYNFGTAVRYKFPFIVVYVIGLSYDFYKIYGYRFDLNLKINNE